MSLSSNPPGAFDATILRPDGTIGIYGASRSNFSLELAVSTGLTYQIDVVSIGGAQSFTLKTTLR